MPDGATSIVSTVVLGKTLFVRLSYDKLYRVSLDNLQDWKEVSLEETSKDFDEDKPDSHGGFHNLKGY